MLLLSIKTQLKAAVKSFSFRYASINLGVLPNLVIISFSSVGYAGRNGITAMSQRVERRKPQMQNRIRAGIGSRTI